MTNHTTSTLFHNDNISLNDLNDKPSYDDINNTSVPSTPITPTNDHDDHVDVEKTNALDPEGLAIAVEQSAHPRANISKWVWIITLIGQYTGALLFGLDTTITATVQASIYKDLGEIEKLPWVGVGFPLASVASILLLSKMNETFQIKWIIIGSLILFEAGSALCGAAPNMNALIIGRVIAGLGGAGAYIGNLTYLSVFTTLKERPIYLALTGLTWGLGAILGPVVGGGFAGSAATWRWAFYINLPLAAIMGPSFIAFPLHNPIPQLSWKAKFNTIDWTGVGLNAVLWTSLIIALTMSGSEWAWKSAPAIAMWIIFAVCLVVYVAQQVFSIFTTKHNRIFPVQFLHRPQMILLFICTASASAAFSVPLYYIPLFFQFTRGDSPLQAAVRLLPYILLYIFFIMVAGGTLPVLGRYAPYYPVGGVLMIIGGALMYTVKPETANGAIYGYSALVGIGSGLTFQNGYSAAAALINPEDKEEGQAIGYINTAQVGCIALALSIAGCIYQNVGFADLQSALASYGLPQDAVRSALAGSESPLFQNPVYAKITVDVVVATMSKMYLMVVAAGGVLVVTSPFLSWKKMQLEMGAA